MAKEQRALKFIEKNIHFFMQAFLFKKFDTDDPQPGEMLNGYYKKLNNVLKKHGVIEDFENFIRDELTLSPEDKYCKRFTGTGQRGKRTILRVCCPESWTD